MSERKTIGQKAFALIEKELSADFSLGCKTKCAGHIDKIVREHGEADTKRLIEVCRRFVREFEGEYPAETQQARELLAAMKGERL